MSVLCCVCLMMFLAAIRAPKKGDRSTAAPSPPPPSFSSILTDSRNRSYKWPVARLLQRGGLVCLSSSSAASASSSFEQFGDHGRGWLVAVRFRVRPEAVCVSVRVGHVSPPRSLSRQAEALRVSVRVGYISREHLGAWVLKQNGFYRYPVKVGQFPSKNSGF